jgi:hypothetical protein
MASDSLVVKTLENVEDFDDPETADKETPNWNNPLISGTTQAQK